jgi:hypothetical protein
MPRRLISDAHEWINEIPNSVPIYCLANPQPRARAWANRRGKKTLLSLTLVWRVGSREGRRVGGRRAPGLAGVVSAAFAAPPSPLKHHHPRCLLAHPVKRATAGSSDQLRGAGGLERTGPQELTLPGFVAVQAGPTRAGERRQAGSLTGAVHLSKGNAGVPRSAPEGQKPSVEQKGKSRPAPGRQQRSGPRERGLAILSVSPGVWGERCRKSYHRDNWLVAAKRS